MKKIISILAIIFLVATTTTACSTGSKKTDEAKIKVVTTIFPPYDFAKAIGKDNVSVKLLLKPGAESHTYEPTPQDIKDIGNSDIFIYTGGENDEWVSDILESLDKEKRPKVLKMLDMVNTLEEEHVEGMQEEEEEHEDKEDEHEIDEHVWTSPKNAIKIAEVIKNELILKDKESEKEYTDNFETLKKDLEDLDKEFKAVVDSGKRKTVLFGDRFPFRYFADEYGLKYYAAFSGCSTDAEASAKTISFLIDRVKKEEIPVVFVIEMSSGKIADTIVESTNAKKLTFHSVHNLTTQEMEKELTYIDLMKENVKNLKTALN